MMQTNISQIDSYLGIDVAKEKITDKPIEPTLIRRPAADYRAVNDALDLILKSKNDWRLYKKSYNLPSQIPRSPEKVYKNNGSIFI